MRLHVSLLYYVRDIAHTPIIKMTINLRTLYIHFERNRSSWRMQTAFKHNKTASSNEYSVNAMLSIYDIILVWTFLRQLNIPLNCSHGVTDWSVSHSLRFSLYILHVPVLVHNIVGHVFPRATVSYGRSVWRGRWTVLLTSRVNKCLPRPTRESQCLWHMQVNQTLGCNDLAFVLYDTQYCIIAHHRPLQLSLGRPGPARGLHISRNQMDWRIAWIVWSI